MLARILEAVGYTCVQVLVQATQTLTSSVDGALHTPLWLTLVAPSTPSCQAVDGRDALEKVRANMAEAAAGTVRRFDVVLSDYQMPQMVRLRLPSVSGHPALAGTTSSTHSLSRF